VTADPDDASDTGLRPYATPLFIGCGLATIWVAYQAGLRLCLVVLYGLARVRSEHLRFVATPKGADWIVSNGDHLAGVGPLHYAVSVVLWLVICPPIFLLLHRLLPEREKTGTAARR